MQETVVLEERHQQQISPYFLLSLIFLKSEMMSCNMEYPFGIPVFSLGQLAQDLAHPPVCCWGKNVGKAQPWLSSVQNNGVFSAPSYSTAKHSMTKDALERTNSSSAIPNTSTQRETKQILPPDNYGILGRNQQQSHKHTVSFVQPTCYFRRHIAPPVQGHCCQPQTTLPKKLKQLK